MGTLGVSKRKSHGIYIKSISGIMITRNKDIWTNDALEEL